MANQIVNIGQRDTESTIAIDVLLSVIVKYSIAFVITFNRKLCGDLIIGGGGPIIEYFLYFY